MNKVISGLRFTQRCIRRSGRMLQAGSELLACAPRIQMRLVGQGNPEPSHPEIVVLVLDHVPGEVSHHANVPGDANFQATTKLANCSRVLLLDCSIFKTFKFESGNIDMFDEEPISMRAAIKHTDAGEGVGCNARAADRVSEGNRAQTGSTGITSAIKDEALDT